MERNVDAGVIAAIRELRGYAQDDASRTSATEGAPREEDEERCVFCGEEGEFEDGLRCKVCAERQDGIEVVPDNVRDRYTTSGVGWPD